jgi:hypothetical protein
MRVLTQDRRHIIKLPKEVWITNSGIEGHCLIVCTSQTAPYLRVYKNEELAVAALEELHQAIKEHEPIYEMA